MLIAALFFLTYLLINQRSWLAIAIIILGLLFDFFWVWPLGTGILALTFFALIIEFYSQKFSYYNQSFLLVILFSYSFIFLKLVNQSTSIKELFIFSVLFLGLSLKLRRLRKQSFRRI